MSNFFTLYSIKIVYKILCDNIFQQVKNIGVSMKIFDIKSEKLEFKNLLSGPAPIGRILNYIYLAGTKGLYHKNGYRKIDLKDNIGVCLDYRIYDWTWSCCNGNISKRNI